MVSVWQVLILAVPPVVPSDPGRPGADLAHMQKLAAAVDGFSLMTYDYATAGPGPNFPLPWQEKNVNELTADVDSSKGSKGKYVTAQGAVHDCSWSGCVWVIERVPVRRL